MQVSPRSQLRQAMASDVAERDGVQCALCSATLPVWSEDVHLQVLVPRSHRVPKKTETVVRLCGGCSSMTGESGIAGAVCSAMYQRKQPRVLLIVSRLEAIMQMWPQANPYIQQQLRLLGQSPSSVGRLERLLRRDGYQCVWCSRSLYVGDGWLTVDHFKPRALGGAGTLDNLVCCCRACNNQRGHTDVDTWTQYCVENGFNVNWDLLSQATKRLSLAQA